MLCAALTQFHQFHQFHMVWDLKPLKPPLRCKFRDSCCLCHYHNYVPVFPSMIYLRQLSVSMTLQPTIPWLSQSAISFPWDGREPSWKRSCTQRWRDREANKIQSREFQEREGKKLVKLENLAINIPIDNPQQHHVFSPVAVVSD